MTYSMEVNYHTRHPRDGYRGTAVTVSVQSLSVCIGIGDGGEVPELRVYVDRAAEAFALAQAFAQAGEVLEKRAAESRVGEVPSAAWADVPLPLDELELCAHRAEACVYYGCTTEKCPAF